MAVIKVFLAGGFGAAFTPSPNEAEDASKVYGRQLNGTFASAAKQLTKCASVRKKMHGRPALSRDTDKKVD